MRSRYDGRIRNPWNEYECGNYYARAMSSYALLSALSGFRYSAVTRTLWFAPKLNTRPFKSFFSTASGFGTITLHEQSLQIQLLEGEMNVEKLIVGEGNSARTIQWHATIRPDSPSTKAL